jgi:hypothetical protein
MINLRENNGDINALQGGIFLNSVTKSVKSMYLERRVGGS